MVSPYEDDRPSRTGTLQAPAPAPARLPAGGADTADAADDAAYAEIADSRPRVRRDVLYTQTPTGVHFHNARGGFSVVMPSAYRFATLVVPHLTGENTVADLCRGLPAKQRAMVVRLVGTLYARGFARDAVPPAPGAPRPEPAVATRFAAQIDYVDHYADGAAERFLRFRGARVAVLGEDRVAHWAALSLLRNGCAAVAVPAAAAAADPAFAEVIAQARELREEGCAATLDTLRLPAAPEDLTWDELDGFDVVLVTGPHAARRTAALAAGIPPGRTLLPAWTFGGSAVVGPLMTRGGSGCWTCAALRLGANGDPADAADLWSSLAPGGPREQPAAAAAGAVRGPLAAMLGNLLGYEVFRLTTGALPAESAGQLVVQDLDSLDTVAEPLLPHPRCPACGTGATPAAVPEAGAVTDLALFDTPDEEPAPDPERPEEDAAQAALTELTDRAVLLQPTAGVFRAFADETWAQTPLKVGTVALGTGHGVSREISAFDVHHVAGARLRALHRAAEVYAEHVVPLPAPLTGAALERARARWTAADPAALGVASGLPADPAAPPAAWCATTSLLGGGTVLVPAAALRTLGPYNRERLAEPTSAGTGAGGTAREAAARGLLTALGHRALRRALHAAIPVAVLDPAGIEAAGDPELTFLIRSSANLGVPLEILDLGAGTEPAAVVLARAADPATGAWRWALGSAPGRRAAILEAVRDLLGAVQLAREPRPAGEAAGPDDFGDPLAPDLAPAALTVTTTAPAGLGAPGGWPALADRLRAEGLDVLAAPVAAPDLAAGRLYVTRVLLLAGGARHGR